MEIDAKIWNSVEIIKKLHLKCDFFKEEIDIFGRKNRIFTK